jgi:hypothetical protein
LSWLFVVEVEVDEWDDDDVEVDAPGRFFRALGLGCRECITNQR